MAAVNDIMSVYFHDDYVGDVSVVGGYYWN